MFACPRCSIRLGRAKVKAGVCWRCNNCHGCAVTLPALRRVLDRDIVNQVWQGARGGEGSAGADCPSCGKATREITAPLGWEGIPLDVCTRCHFVWFDGDEYDAAEEMGRPRERPPRRAAREYVTDRTSAEALAEFELAHAKEMQKTRHNDLTRHGTDPPDAYWKYMPGLLGFPVEFDDHPVVRQPIVTYGVMALVSLVSIMAFQTDAWRTWGFIPDEPLRNGGLTFLTSFFLHGGWWHLISNMYFLWVFGDNVEDSLGHGRFLALMGLGVLGGAVGHAITAPDTSLPSVGASDAVSGVIAFYALKYPHMRLGLLFFFVAWLRIPAIVAFFLWLGLQFWGIHRGYVGVAYGAHLGGAAVGVIFWWLYRNE